MWQCTSPQTARLRSWLSDLRLDLCHDFIAVSGAAHHVMLRRDDAWPSKVQTILALQAQACGKGNPQRNLQGPKVVHPRNSPSPFLLLRLVKLWQALNPFSVCWLPSSQRFPAPSSKHDPMILSEVLTI